MPHIFQNSVGFKPQNNKCHFEDKNLNSCQKSEYQEQGTTFDDDIKAEQDFNLKNIIAGLNKENQLLKLQLENNKEQNEKSREISRKLFEQKISKQINPFKQENKNLLKINKIYNEEIEVLKEEIRLQKKQINSLKIQGQKSKQLIEYLKNENQQLTKLFKTFEKQQISLSLNQISIYKEILKKNCQINKKNDKSEWNQFRQQSRKVNEQVRVLNKSIGEANLLTNLSEELVEIKRFLDDKKSKYIKNTKSLYFKLVEKMKLEQQNVLDQTYNVYIRRINNLKCIVIKLVNLISGTSQIYKDLKEIKKSVKELKQKTVLQSQQTFQKLLEMLGKKSEKIKEKNRSQGKSSKSKTKTIQK